MITSNTTPQDLANLLGTDYSHLCYVLYGKGTTSLYETFNVPKKSGGERLIHAPVQQLKILQSRLKEYLEQLYKPHPAASAFITGRGIAYNAKKHLRKAAVFNIDLEDYFGSINFGRIKGMLEAKPYSLQENTAKFIAHLCCVKGFLPQGAPTSPVVSNMVVRFLDSKLSHLAKLNKAFYTRYADDITFSFHSLDENTIYLSDGSVHKVLESTINKSGFVLNKKKPRLNLYDERQVVTGLKVNSVLNVDRRFIRTTRAMVFSLLKGIENANRIFWEKTGRDGARLENVVWGRINFIGMIKGRKSTVYVSLAKKFNTLEISLKVRFDEKPKLNPIDKKLRFDSALDTMHLQQTVWRVHFDDIEKANDECGFISGSAFMIRGGRLVSAGHIFDKADMSRCFVERRTENGLEKYPALIIRKCQHLDLVELKICNGAGKRFPCLDLSKSGEHNQGYKVSVVGFPEHAVGQKSVTITPTVVVNTEISSLRHYAIVRDAIRSGNSGGPVLDAYQKVVGMAVKGATTVLIPGKDSGHPEIGDDGENKYLSVRHFLPETLDEMPVLLNVFNNYLVKDGKKLCLKCYLKGVDHEIYSILGGKLCCYRCDELMLFN